MLEATLVLATIVQRYRLNLDPGIELVPEPLITLRPRGQLWVSLHPVDAAEAVDASESPLTSEVS